MVDRAAHRFLERRADPVGASRLAMFRRFPILQAAVYGHLQRRGRIELRLEDRPPTLPEDPPGKCLAGYGSDGPRGEVILDDGVAGTIDAKLPYFVIAVDGLLAVIPLVPVVGPSV